MQVAGNLDTKKHMVIILRNFVGTFPLYDNTHGTIEHVGIAAEFDMDATELSESCYQNNCVWKAHGTWMKIVICIQTNHASYSGAFKP